jgi:hypothetical protein
LRVQVPPTSRERSFPLMVDSAWVTEQPLTIHRAN